MGESRGPLNMINRNTILSKRWLWVLLVLGVLSFYPFESTVVPTKSVLVTAESGKPIEGAKVRQSWKNYSLETDGHEEDLFTDKNGRVSFPRRTLRASIWRRLYRPVANIFGQGVHASFGVQSEVLELGGGTENTATGIAERQPGDILFRRRSA
jgi:hypothetical protein